MPKRYGPVTVFTSSIWQTNSTVVERKDVVLLFDPAYFPHEIAEIAAWVNGVRRGRPLVLVLTHGDWDHIVGAAPFADAVVVAHAAAPGRLPEQAAKARAFDEQYYVARDSVAAPPRVNRLVAAEEEDAALGVRFVPVPGHTADMMAAYFPEEGVLVAGDMLSDLEFPFLDDSARYLDSLERLEKLIVEERVSLLVPGHGTPATDREEMLRRLRRDRRYIEDCREALREGIARGETEDALRRRFAAVRFDGRPISGALLAMHEENFDVLVRERGSPR